MRLVQVEADDARALAREPRDARRARYRRRARDERDLALAASPWPPCLHAPGESSDAPTKVDRPTRVDRPTGVRDGAPMDSPATTRPQPRDGADARHRSGRAGRRPLDGPGRQERRRRRRGRGHARRAQHASRWTASSSSARARRTKRRCCSTASRSATARAPQMDIAVDPIDGTTLTSLGRHGAIAVIALSERGTMFDPGPCVYMEKIAAGPAGRRRDRPQRAGEGEPRSGRQGARRARRATSPR